MRFHLCRAALLSAVSLSIAPPLPAQRPQSRQPVNDALRIPFERYTLPNGLTVILSPNPVTPQVAVDVWYHVGSKNEVRDRTGFAHLFEHVMFTGSGHAPYPLHDRLTGGVGGNNNGSTSSDRTNYYENVPANYLESTLWLEADRMGFLLDVLDSAKFSAQRDIVQNERRQGVDNQPYGRVFEILRFATYPDTNPYSWPVIGYMTDLQAASLDDVKNFFRLYYAPSNATLAIVGDFEPAQAKQWVTKYFGGLPRGSAIARPAAKPPRLSRERRLVFEDRVQIPRLYLQWPTTGLTHGDAAPLDVLSRILVGSRTARLTKALVYDEQSAANVFGFPNPSETVGEFIIGVVPRPGHDLTSLERSVDSIINRMKREGPTAQELERALAGLEFDFVSGLETNLARAEALVTGSVFFGDPGRYRTDYLALKAVTASDIKRVLNTYFGPGRVVLSIVPEGKTDLASRPTESRRVTAGARGGNYVVEER